MRKDKIHDRLHSGDSDPSRPSGPIKTGASESSAKPAVEADHKHYAGIRPEKGSTQQAPRDIAMGKVNSLGSSEADVMDVIWDFERAVTPMEVCEELLYRRRKNKQEPLSFSTVSTILRRLSEKSVLLQSQHASRTPIYSPTITREDMAARILNNVTEKILRLPLSGLLPAITGTLRNRSSRSAGASVDANSISSLVDAIEKVCAEDSTNRTDTDLSNSD